MRKLRIVVCPTGAPAYTDYIAADDSQKIKELVNGYAEATLGSYYKSYYLVCNEDGKINGTSLPNRPLLDPSGKTIVDIIYDDFFFVGRSRKTLDMCSLTKKDAEKLEKFYKLPCNFDSDTERINLDSYRDKDVNILEQWAMYE